MSRSYVQYGVRNLNDGFGIAVDVIRNGRTVTQDRNKTAWPSFAVALDRAKRSAEAEAEREGIALVRPAGAV